MNADTVWNKYELFDSLGIEDWLLPACYAGHFSTVFWIKPEWSKQIPPGQYKILLGKFKNYIRLYSNIYYFVSDGVCVAENDLENIKELVLNVCSVNDFELISNKVFEQCHVLDIDLDFFSTKNPFSEMLDRGDIYSKLKTLFSFDLPSNIILNSQIEEVETVSNKTMVLKVSDEREKQLKKLDGIFEHLKSNDSIETIERELPKASVNLIKDIEKCAKEYYDNVDWSLLHTAGLTCDAVDLPEHIGTETELVKYFEQFEEFLKNLKNPPVIVTIARSVSDDYCPPEKVDFIQTNVVKILQNVFGRISIHRHYEDNTIL